MAVGAELAVIGDAGGRPAAATAASSRSQEPEQAQQQGDPQQQAGARSSRRQPAARPSLTGASPAAGAGPQPAPFQQAPRRATAAAQPPSAGAASQQQAPAPAAGHRPQRPRPGEPDGDGDGSAVRDPAGPQARRRARRRPRQPHGHRRRRAHPQAGRARRRQAAAGSSRPRERAGSRRAGAAAARLRRPAASPLRGTTEKMSRLRKVIATRMVESLQVSAQLTTVVEVDVTRIARLRHAGEGRLRGPRGRQAVVPAVLRQGRGRGAEGAPEGQRQHRQAKGEIVYHDAEHLGVAVDTERGLLVPVIKDAGDLNIAGLARKIADLAERTRNNKMSPTSSAAARSR